MFFSQNYFAKMEQSKYYKFDPWYDENELQRKIETINKQERPPSNIWKL